MVFYDTRSPGAADYNISISTIEPTPIKSEQTYCLQLLIVGKRKHSSSNAHGLWTVDTAPWRGERVDIKAFFKHSAWLCVMCGAGFTRQMACPGPRRWVLDVDPGLTVKEGTRSRPGQKIKELLSKH